MELRHVENVARYLRQVGYQAKIQETTWRTARWPIPNPEGKGSIAQNGLVFFTEPEPARNGGFSHSVQAEIFMPEGEAQTIRITLHFRAKNGALDGDYHLPVDTATIQAHGEREAIPGLLAEIAKEAAGAAWDAHGQLGPGDDYPGSDMGWDFITTSMAELEDERLDLVAGGEPPTFKHLYDQELEGLLERERQRALTALNEYRARLEGAKIVFPDGTSFALTLEGK